MHFFVQGVVQVDYYYLSSEKFSCISFSNKPAERIAAHDKNSVRGKTPADSKTRQGLFGNRGVGEVQFGRKGFIRVDGRRSVSCDIYMHI